MPATLTTSGLQIQTLAEILDELRKDFAASGAFPGHDFTSATSPLALLIALQARREAIYQAQLAAVLDALYRDGAQGRVLDRLATITGDLPRQGPSQSTISARLTGTPGVDCANKLVRYAPNGSLWRTPGIDATIGGGGTVDVTLRAEDDGPVTAEEGSADWEVVTGTTGWTGVQSLGDLQVGELEEDDVAFRARLVASESVARGTEQALVAALLRVPGVTSVSLDNNRTLVTNGNGVPGKSVEALVVGGSDAEVAGALFAALCADTGTFGNTTIAVERPDGRSQDVAFSRIEDVQCYVRVTLTATGAEEDLPADYADQVRAAVAARAAQLAPGQNLQQAWFVGAIVDALPTNSVVDVAVVFDLNPGGVGATTLAFDNRERGVISNAATPGLVVGDIAQPFAVTPGWQLVLAIDGGADQTFVLAGGAALTAQDLVDEISPTLTGATASAMLGRLRIESDTVGVSSEVEVRPGSTAGLLAVLGLAVNTYSGADNDIVSVTVV